MVVMRALTFSLAVSALFPVPATAVDTPRAAQWWGDIAVVASDANEGRQTGSAGHLRAADYVERRLKELGLSPAGDAGGYRQQVPLEEQTVDFEASRAMLVGKDGAAATIDLGREMIVAASGGPRFGVVDAPLVFIGYGLHLPDQGHDDFAGVDLRGKIAVVIAGGPADIPGPVKASNRRERSRLLGLAGAVGLITLVPPDQIEIPWERQLLLATQPGMYLADAASRDMPDNFFLASFAPAASERLFAGTGHSFAALAAAADASSAVPALALPFRLKAKLVTHHRLLTSPNLVARLEGSDPVLAKEYVVVSAHLDHIGIGPAINGDAIYNGALDDGSGVASVLDIADRLRAGPKPKRSILFLIVTAEEPGLLGSTFFTRHPTVPRASIVADFNFDTLLPLWPLTSILAQGDQESSLGDAARTIAAEQKLELVPDPLPNRNSFVRTDQYSFVRAGIPALALKFGFTSGSEAFRLEHEWRKSRYHAPSDDSNQPGVRHEEAIRFDDYAADLIATIANTADRPVWREDSIFRRFVAPPIASR
jgi:hypothetical protein